MDDAHDDYYIEEASEEDTLVIMRDYRALISQRLPQRRVPQYLVKRFILESKRAIEDVIVSKGTAQARALLDFLSIPRRLLNTKKRVQERGLDEHVDDDDGHGNGRQTRSSTSDQLQCKIKKAEGLIRGGKLSRAVKALLNNSSPRLSDVEFLEKAISLHPQEEEHIPAPPNTRRLQLCHIDLSDKEQNRMFFNCIKSRDNGSSPGPSGWSGEMLRLLTVDKDTCQALTRLIELIATRRLNHTSSIMLLPSLLSMPEVSAGKHRPIAAGELIYRAVTTFYDRRNATAISRILTPIQLGWEPAGCERVVHTINAQLTNSDKPRVGIAIDAKNAFNTVSRAAMFTELYKHVELAGLWDLAYWAYSKPSTLFFHGDDGITDSDELRSSQGGRQGCTLAKLLYCLAMHPDYKSTLAKFCTTALAIVDDLTVVAETTRQAIDAFKHFKCAAQKRNVEVNAAKSIYMNFHKNNKPTVEEEAELRDLGIQIKTQAAPLLGSFIGINKEDICNLALTKVQNEYSDAFECVHHMSIQCGMLILKYSTCPSLNYMNRTLHPDSCDTVARDFDRKTANAACTMLTVKNTPRIREQLFLPTRDNIGFGLKKNEDSHVIAYIASIAMSMHHDQLDTLNTSFMCSEQVKCIDSTLQHANETFKDNNVMSYEKGKQKDVLQYPTSTSELCDRARDGDWVSCLHRSTCKAMSDATLRNIRLQHALSTHKLKIFDSLVLPGSATWINGLPSSKSTTIQDDEYKIGANLRLDVPPFDVMPRRCKGMLCGANLDDEKLHYYNCARIGCGMVNKRHNDVRDTIISAAKRAGYTTFKEPAHTNASNSIRTDMHLLARDRDDMIGDVVIANTCQSGMTAVAVLKKKVSEKKNAYSADTDRRQDLVGTKFVPLIFSIFGAVEERARQCMSTIASHAVLGDDCYSYNEFLQQLQMEVAVAIQRGNFRLVRAAHRCCMQRAWYEGARELGAA